MSRRTRAVASLLLLMTFAVGGLAGMALEEALGLDWFDFLDEDAAPDDSHLLAGIELSPEQRTAVARVLEQQEERLEAYWERRFPEIQAILSTSYARIGVILNGEQRAIFEQRVRDLGSRAPALTPLPATD